MVAMALSVAGSAFLGPLGGMLGAAAGGLIDNLLFPAPKQPGPSATASTYGNAIALPWGPLNRMGGNLTWSSGFRKVTNKSLKFLAGKGGSAAAAQQYVADVMISIGAGPLQPSWCKKIWANGTVIFDATAGTGQPTPDGNGVVTWTHSFLTFQDFESITVYPGNRTQLPDPTMEAALGIGNVPAYRGTAYVLIKSLKLTSFGNAIPNMNFLVAAQSSITLGQVVLDICTRCGLDPNTVSTSALTTAVSGYQINSQTDGASALQPLSLCYDFDVAEVAGSLRFQPRGLAPIACITNDMMGAYAFGDTPPDAFQWPRGPETDTPQLAALTFKDPARDNNDNTQSARRVTGSAQNNIANNVMVTLTSDQARKICDRQLWEAQIARQTFQAPVDDRLIWVQAANTYAVESPAGFEQVRITRVTRGVNGVIQIEGKRDYSALYFSSALGANSEQQANVLAIGGPVNPPLFIEPPSSFPGLTGPTIFIAVSGGDGTTANDAWNGCTVYASTDDTNFTMIGQVSAPAIMGKLIGDLEPHGGGNPDTISILDVTTLESGQAPPNISLFDAEIATAPYYVGGEYLSAETVTSLGGGSYKLTNLWRHLYGSHGDTHVTGQPFARLDSAIFRFPLPVGYLGVSPMYFKFVSAGETLATAVTYTYTGTGAGYGTAAGGHPSVPAAPTTSPGANFVTVTTAAAAAEDNVQSFDVYRAPGLGQPFGAATKIASAVGATYTDPTAAPATSYTYFSVANNAVGASAPTAGTNVTTAASSGTNPFAITLSVPDISTATPGAIIGRFPASVAWSLPAGQPNSQGFVTTAPGATTTFTIEVGGIAVGTAVWAAGSHTPTFTASATAVAEGQYVDIVAPSSFNGMAGAFGLTLAGTS